jgi:uncharacterized protein with GYD domain
MAKFVVLGSWTDQGIKAAKDTVDRAREAASTFEKAGVKMTSILWTIGAYDFVATVEASDDESAVAVLLALGGAGNVRTQTMRAFDESEMSSILSKVS